MKVLTTLLVLGGAAGIGCLLYKKMSQNKEKTEAYTEYKEESRKNGKIHRASMYAVGTIKTTADKISEGIKQVKTEDMVKKGEETIEQIKETGENFKEQIKITTGSIKGEINETHDNIKEELKETTDSIKDELKETGSNINDDLKDIKNLVTSINTSSSEIEGSEENTDASDDNTPAEVSEVEQLDTDETTLFEEKETSDQI